MDSIRTKEILFTITEEQKSQLQYEYKELKRLCPDYPKNEQEYIAYRIASIQTQNKALELRSHLEFEYKELKRLFPDFPSTKSEYIAYRIDGFIAQKKALR